MFLKGIKKLSDEALQAAVLMKHAGQGNRCLQALVMACQAKEVEYYSRLMKEIYLAKYHNHQEYSQAYAEGRDILLKAEEVPHKTHEFWA